MVVTPEFLAFRNNGYWIEHDVFSTSEIDLLTDNLTQSPPRSRRGGRRHLMQSPAVRAFANDRRLLEIAVGLTGNEMIPYKATLFEKTEQANWLVAFHQDTALPIEVLSSNEGWDSKSVKIGTTYVHAPTEALTRILALRIHLDDSTLFNGPLRVIPGSHQKHWLTDEEFGIAAKTNGLVECTTNRGGVIAMRPLIIHASSKAMNSEPRRVLHIEYAESLDLLPGVRLAIA